MKLVVIGGVAGGASAAARVRRLDESAQIVIFERGQYVSFSNCSLPYYLSGTVADPEDLVMMMPEDFRSRYNIEVHTHCEVTDIDREAKLVTIKNIVSDKIWQEAYDKLVIATGASPIMPKNITGIDLPHVFSVRNVDDVVAIKYCLDSKNVENVAVVGGGFIGAEVAENLCSAGKKVSVVEGMSQIMATLDYDMVQILHKELNDHGVRLYVNTMVTEIEAGQLHIYKDGESLIIPADAVIMSVGVVPEAGLAYAAGLSIGSTGGIRINRYCQTDDPDIYAVGDVVENFQRQTGAPGRLALAGIAQKQARIAANHIYALPSENKGFISSSCIKLFDLNVAVTGLNEHGARASDLTFDSVTVLSSTRVSFMPNADYLMLKLLFEIPTGKLFGAQAIGRGEADKRVNVIAALINMDGTVFDLEEFEHCYAPMFSTAKDVVHMAALTADNVLSGWLKQVHVQDVRNLVEQNAYIIDVRNEDEFAAGHIINAHNIPLPVLRKRLHEIPHNVPVYLHCRSGQRSYFAYCCLRGNGFDNVINMSGSFLGLSLYEYFNDKSQHREKVVTEYNFE